VQGCVLDWSSSSWWPVKGFCEHSNETSDILKSRAFLGELNDYPLLQEHVIPRNQTKRGIRHVSRQYGPAHCTCWSNTATRAQKSRTGYNSKIDITNQTPFCPTGKHVYLLHYQRVQYIVNKTNRRTEFQFYWYYDSTRFGQPFCPSSGVLSRTSALVHFMQFDDRLLTTAGWTLLLVANGHQTA
jgi:acid phosphatase class B